jgi:hypothetical protein
MGGSRRTFLSRRAGERDARAGPASGQQKAGNNPQHPIPATGLPRLRRRPLSSVRSCRVLGGPGFQPRQKPLYPSPKINQRDQVALAKRIGLGRWRRLTLLPCKIGQPLPVGSRAGAVFRMSSLEPVINFIPLESKEYQSVRERYSNRILSIVVRDGTLER